jgi:hypothetical protein
MRVAVGQCGAISGAMERVGARRECDEAQQSVVGRDKSTDSKSRVAQAACGFDSHLRHHSTRSLRSLAHGWPRQATEANAPSEPLDFARGESNGSQSLGSLHALAATTAPAENLGRFVSSEFREFDPFIAPDERCLTLASTPPGGLGGADLSISLREANGAWVNRSTLRLASALNRWHHCCRRRATGAWWSGRSDE